MNPYADRALHHVVHTPRQIRDAPLGFSAVKLDRLKWIGLGLAGATTFGVAVVGVERLVATSAPVAAGQGGRGYWAEAIQAVSTVVVMAATTVYAAISYHMMQAIKQQTATMSASSTRAHVTELSRFLTTWLNPLIALKASVAPGSGAPSERLTEQENALESVTSAIFALASFGGSSSFSGQ